MEAVYSWFSAFSALGGFVVILHQLYNVIL